MQRRNGAREESGTSLDGFFPAPNQIALRPRILSHKLKKKLAMRLDPVGDSIITPQEDLFSVMAMVKSRVDRQLWSQEETLPHPRRQHRDRDIRGVLLRG
jgi:hypothetical protein